MAAAPGSAGEAGLSLCQLPVGQRGQACLGNDPDCKAVSICTHPHSLSLVLAWKEADLAPPAASVYQAGEPPPCQGG